jgi:hypothetical protein
VSAEASNILRRFIRVAAGLDPLELRYLKKAARTLEPAEIRRLALELNDVLRRRRRAGDQPPTSQPGPVAELRGLARSIIRYGGPEAVRRDADEMLVNVVIGMGWGQ